MMLMQTKLLTILTVLTPIIAENLPLGFHSNVDFYTLVALTEGTKQELFKPTKFNTSISLRTNSSQ
jgi:hypothetical protein